MTTDRTGALVAFAQGIGEGQPVSEDAREEPSEAAPPGRNHSKCSGRATGAGGQSGFAGGGDSGPKLVAADAEYGVAPGGPYGRQTPVEDVYTPGPELRHGRGWGGEIWSNIPASSQGRLRQGWDGRRGPSDVVIFSWISSSLLLGRDMGQETPLRLPEARAR